MLARSAMLGIRKHVQLMICNKQDTQCVPEYTSACQVRLSYNPVERPDQMRRVRHLKDQQDEVDG